MSIWKIEPPLPSLKKRVIKTASTTFNIQKVKTRKWRKSCGGGKGHSFGTWSSLNLFIMFFCTWIHFKACCNYLPVMMSEINKNWLAITKIISWNYFVQVWQKQLYIFIFLYFTHILLFSFLLFFLFSSYSLLQSGTRISFGINKVLSYLIYST